VAEPLPKAAPYALPRGRRKRRHDADPEDVTSAMRDAGLDPAQAPAPATAPAKVRAKAGGGDLTPAEMQRLVKGVRWEKESYEEYRAQSLPATSAKQATLGPDITVIGRVECDGHIELHGIVEGEILCDSVSIAVGGKVLGSIVAQQVWVAGAIEGPVTAHTVTLAKTARVDGSIFHRELHMEPGARHKGRRPWRLNPLENR
jgi:cytoskeletal protein CcmA (bactofilin family)